MGLKQRLKSWLATNGIPFTIYFREGKAEFAVESDSHPPIYIRISNQGVDIGLTPGFAVGVMVDIFHQNQVNAVIWTEDELMQEPTIVPLTTNWTVLLDKTQGGT